MIMNNTHYRLALTIIWKGFVIFFRSWGVTLDRLLHDILHGIRHHWLFAVSLVALYVVMFVIMAQSRAMYHHTGLENYRLRQSLDSIRLIVEK